MWQYARSFTRIVRYRVVILFPSKSWMPRMEMMSDLPEHVPLFHVVNQSLKMHFALFRMSY